MSHKLDLLDPWLSLSAAETDRAHGYTPPEVPVQAQHVWDCYGMADILGFYLSF